jgi:nitroreductase/Pyruvate/2-oxoacid:ferredoxin oxidoreductase delta subunit
MIQIDNEKCKACGICGHICPRHIPVTIENGNKKSTTISSERVSLCMECGHCMAVCSNHAIQIECLNEEEFLPVKKLDIDQNQLFSLMKQRRSVRRYKDKPVERKIIDQIIDAASASPTGSGRMTTGIIVIDNPKSLSTLSELIYKEYEELEKYLQNPMAKLFIKRQVKQRKGKQMLGTLLNFVMPGMHWYIRWYREGKSDEIFRDCPALMLFHSPINEPMNAYNCAIAAFHAILMAEVLGVGTCFNDLIPQVCFRDPIRELLNLPENREVYASITMGYAKYPFKRTPPRRLAEARYLR